jgi:hypothetical protein
VISGNCELVYDVEGLNVVMIRHPLNRAEYRKQPDGLVAVTWTDGVSGVFDRAGNWIKGSKRTADPALCLWVACGSDENTVAVAYAGNANAASKFQEERL